MPGVLVRGHQGDVEAEGGRARDDVEHPAQAGEQQVLWWPCQVGSVTIRASNELSRSWKLYNHGEGP